MSAHNGSLNKPIQTTEKATKPWLRWGWKKKWMNMTNNIKIWVEITLNSSSRRQQCIKLRMIKRFTTLMHFSIVADGHSLYDNYLVPATHRFTWPSKHLVQDCLLILSLLTMSCSPLIHIFVVVTSHSFLSTILLV